MSCFFWSLLGGVKWCSQKSFSKKRDTVHKKQFLFSSAGNNFSSSPKKNNSFRKNHEKLACFSVALLIVKPWEHSSTPERKIVDRIWFPSPSSKVIFFPCSPTSFSVLVKKNRKIQQKTQNNGLFFFKGNNFGKFFSTVKSKKKYFTSAYFARERRLRCFASLSHVAKFPTTDCSR